jgi:hypothetical protein
MTALKSWAVCALVTVFIISAVAPFAVYAFTAAELVTRDTPIPKGYKSWSLFLICNPEWLLPQNKDRVTDLYYRFRAFGETIGPEHAAVWFWIRKPNWITDTAVDNVDVERSVIYCQRLKLAPSASPYVFLTTKYPESASDRADYFTLALNGKSPDEIQEILSALTDELVLQGGPVQRPDTEGFWRNLQAGFEAVQRSLGTLLVKVTVSFNTQWFKVEYKY